ncbi:MAG TPA: oligosaccharide flippase family protein [Pyrinomonadaceae bacterium]|nr:oligosaccharide flippase family protein [Pyrinomonadaceae bacterium]
MEVKQHEERRAAGADDSSRMSVSASTTSSDVYTSTHPDAASTPPRRRFLTHVAWTVIARFLIMAGGLVASIIVARVLGAEGLGALAVINVTVAVALQFGCAGLPSANTYFISKDRRELAPVWANALLFGLAAGTLLAVLVAVLAYLRPTLFGSVSFQLILTAIISIPFQLVTFLGLNVFLGIERIAQFNLLDAFSQSFVLVNAVVALVVLDSGLTVLVALNTAASILICGAVIWMIGRIVAQQKEGRTFRPDMELLRRMAHYGVKFHVAVVASLLIFRADLLIVNHFRGEAEAGSYSVASQMAMLLMMLPGVIATLIFPRVTAARDREGHLIMRATRHTSFIMLVVCLMAVPAAFLLPLLYGPAFRDVPVQLLILLPGIYLVGVESVLVQYFSSTGLPVAIPLFWVVTLLLNVLLNLLFVPTFGARAAAFASTASYALIFLLVVFYFRRKTGNSFSQTFMLRRGELRELFARVRKSSAVRES